MAQHLRGATPMPPLPSAGELLRLPAVLQFTGLGRSTLYRLVATQQFPSPVKLATRAVAWRRAEVQNWADTRPSACP